MRPEKVEPIRSVDDTRLVRAQGQTQAPNDVLQPSKPRLRVPTAENHQVVTVMGQRVKACLQIGVDDLSCAPRDVRLISPMASRAPRLGRKPYERVAKVRFKDRFNHQLDGGLDNAVTNRRDAEATSLPRFPRLRDIYPSDRHRVVPFLSELAFELVKYPVHAVRLDLRDRLFVYPGAAAVPADPLPRFLQHVSSALPWARYSFL